MISNREVVALIALGCLLASNVGANSQTSSEIDEIAPAFKRCSSWRVVPGLPEGKTLFVTPYWIGGAKGDLLNPQKERRGTGWIDVDGGKEVREGTFIAPKPLIIGKVEVLTGDPRRTQYPADGSRPPTGIEFILPTTSTIDFSPDRSTSVVELWHGYFNLFTPRPAERDLREFYSIICRVGTSGHLEAIDDFDTGSRAGRRPVAPNPEPTPMLTERLKGPITEALRPPESIPDSALPGLSGVFKESNRPGPPLSDLMKPPGSPSGIGSKFASSAKPETSPPPSVNLSPGGKSSDGASLPDVSKSPAVSGKEPSPFPDVVCDAQTLRPAPVLKDVKLEPLQAVGVRNEGMSANGFEYLVSGDSLPLGKKIDVAESVKKLVPYESVATMRAGGSSTLLVSIPGMSDRPSKPADNASVKSGKSLRILVVAGAAELGISGLDLIDTSLNAVGGDRVGLDIEWQLVDPSGSTKLVGQYPSFGGLVRAASEKGAERPDVLDETQLLALLDTIEDLLRSRKVDKVFWVKGAYPVPSSIPQRLEQLLANVASSDAVPHTPNGQAVKWLQILTARMAGFSIAYLKEPVNKLQSGDVLEEGSASVSGSRRLINAEDANVLASKLRAGLAFSSAATKPARDATPDRTALSGKLVLNADEVFLERGYVLSADSAVALSARLQTVLNLWNDKGALNNDVLADFATKTGRPQPTLLDLLQLGDSKDNLRLPRTLPGWSRKPLKGLNSDENEKARGLVSTYAGRVASLVVRTNSPASSSTYQCNLFYVPEVSLGFK